LGTEYIVKKFKKSLKSTRLLKRGKVIKLEESNAGAGRKKEGWLEKGIIANVRIRFSARGKESSRPIQSPEDNSGDERKGRTGKGRGKII